MTLQSGAKEMHRGAARRPGAPSLGDSCLTVREGRGLSGVTARHPIGTQKGDVGGSDRAHHPIAEAVWGGGGEKAGLRDVTGGAVPGLLRADPEPGPAQSGPARRAWGIADPVGSAMPRG